MSLCLVTEIEVRQIFLMFCKTHHVQHVQKY